MASCLRKQKAQLSLGCADRTAFIRRPASDFWSWKENDFSKSLWCCCYINRYNQRYNTKLKFGARGYGCRQQLCIQNCGQTAADRHGYYWQPIGTLHRPIQRYHRPPLTTYCLARIHALQTTTDDRQQTDGQTTQSYTKLNLMISQKLCQCNTGLSVGVECWQRWR